MKINLIIPARYGSTRFPGKPLAKIDGRSMLSRVVDIAITASEDDKDIGIAVATEDGRIQAHCEDIGVSCLMTSDHCRTGTDRIIDAVKSLSPTPDFIINIQGDTPFTPPSIIRELIETCRNSPDSDVITPVHQLSWEELDTLRERKQQTPFSGTTVTMTDEYRALWFSKTILPSIRKERGLRDKSDMSPVWQHIGIYAYSTHILPKFERLPTGRYEDLEGLEQLRFLENGIPIQCVPVKIETGQLQGGIDSPEDIEFAEKILRQQKSA